MAKQLRLTSEKLHHVEQAKLQISRICDWDYMEGGHEYWKEVSLRLYRMFDNCTSDGKPYVETDTPAEMVASEGSNVSDPVNHPKHYTSHPSGIECIQVTEHMGFNLGNATKYIWRADLKGDAIEDLKKAKWYIDREIQKREAAK